MKIVHIIWGLGIGGAETMLVDIVNIQVRTESVAIVVVNDTVEDSLLQKIDPRCKVKFCGRKIGSKNLIPWIKLNAFLLCFRPDIIHFHLPGMLKLVFYPAPKVFTIHNAYSSSDEYPKYKALYAISDGVKNYTNQQGFGSITIWNGINTCMVKQKVKYESFKDGICKIICIGRLHIEHKGQDILIDAINRLKIEGINNIHLDLIGDGDSRGLLEKQVKLYQLCDNVTFLGSKDRSYIYQHICDYDLCVLPSRSEGFGLTVAEAMCAKVPVMVSNLEGPMEVIDGGRLGMHFKSEDAEDLTNRLDIFIKKGPDPETIEAAWKYANENFDIKRVAARYVEEYKKIVKR